jgi:membrane-bound lytic murein transglycosylase D
VTKSTPAPTKPTPVVTTKPVSTERPTASSIAGTMKHKVEPGQTYYSISKQYGITVDELRSMNNLSSSDVLVVGKELTVKGSPSPAASTAATNTASKPAAIAPASKPTPTAPVKETAAATGETTYHTVEKGETMFRISKNFGVTIEQIQTWNNLTTTEVKVGQKIKIVK